MAYSIKYLFKFESAAGTTREIRVLKDGYSGDVIQRPLGRAPMLKKQQNGPVHGTSLEFFAECNVDREFIEFYTSNPKDYRVDLYAGSTLLWQGYITPELYSEPDIAPPYDVQVVATDGVGELKLYDYAAQGTVTLRTLLSGLLGRTGLGTDIYLISLLKPGSAGAGSLLEKTINLDYMAGKTCYEVLTYILDTLHATITWWKGTWILTRETNVTFTNGKVRYFNTAGNSALLNDSVQVLGKMYTNPAWPVGQLSTVIDPAKNKVTVQAPWHTVTCLQNPEMTSDTAWAKYNSAAYNTGTGGYYFPYPLSGTPQLRQQVSMAGIRVPLTLSVRATAATAAAGQGAPTQIGAALIYTVGGTSYHLRKGTDGGLVWEAGSDVPSGAIPPRGAPVDFTQALAMWDAGRIEAEELTIENIPAFMQNGAFPAGTLTVYILGYCATVYGAYLDVVLPKGYQDILRLDNGARGEGNTVEIAIGRETADNAYYAAFLQGLLLDSGNLITSFSDANFTTGMDYLAFIARDYALSVALPRAKVTGTVFLESSVQIPPLVFTKGLLDYWLETFAWNLYEDELEIEARTLPSASLTVESETILESDGSTVSSSSGSGGSASSPMGGGGSNYFEPNEDLQTLIQLKSNYEYLGARDGLFFTGGDTSTPTPDLYVDTVNNQRVLRSPLPLITGGDQIVLDGTPGGGGGGGGATTLAGLDDTNINNPAATQVLQYLNGKWTNVNSTEVGVTTVATSAANGLMSYSDFNKLAGIATGATAVTESTVSGWGFTKNTGTVTSVKVGSSTYNPTSGLISLPAYLTAHQTVTLASGTNNGTLKLTTAAGTVDNIAVKGLGSIAYKATSDYLAYSTERASSTNAIDLNDYTSSTDGEMKLVSWDNAGSQYAAHRPVTSSRAASLYVLPNRWGGMQLYVDYNSSVYYLRNKYNDWTSWVEMYHSGNSNKSNVAWTCSTLTANGVVSAKVADQVILSLARTDNSYASIEFLGKVDGTADVALGRIGYNTSGAWVRDASDTAYRLIYHQGNANKSDVPWACSTLTASGLATLTGGASIPATSSLKIGSATITWNSNGYLHIDKPLVTAGDQIVISGTPGGGGGGGATTLNGLDDVSVSSLANNNVLVWDSTLRSGQGAWKNVAASSIGGVTSVVGQTGAVTAEQIASALTSAGYQLTDTTYSQGTGISISGTTISLASTYAGGTAVTLNGQSKASNTASFYAPSAGGAANKVLIGKGTSAAPEWSGFTLTGTANTAYNLANFLTGNQTITLSGDVSGSGTTSISVSIGSGKVTNAMLAGSIAWSKLSVTAQNLYDLIGDTKYAPYNAAGYLPLTGGYIQSASGNNRLRITTDGSANYIQSWASNTASANLNISGYNGNAGSNLYLKFDNVYAWDGSANKVVYHAGNFVAGTNYQAPMSQGTGITISNNQISVTANTYAPYNANGYLPLNGGTLSGVLFLNYANARIGFQDGSGTTLGVIGVRSAGTLEFYDTTWRTVYHSNNSNKSDVAWDCSTLTASSAISASHSSQEVLSLTRTNNSFTAIAFFGSVDGTAGVALGKIGYSTSGAWVRDASDTAYRYIYHEGNLTKSVLTTLLESSSGYYVKKSGDTMTGALTLNADTTSHGSIYLDNNKYIYGTLANGTTTANLLGMSSADQCIVAYGMRSTGTTTIYGQTMNFRSAASVGPEIHFGCSTHNATAATIYFNSHLTDPRNGIKIGAEYAASADRLNLVVYTSNVGTSPYAPSWSPTLKVTYTGRVGIGLSAPSEKLHVSGNILSTGDQVVSSDLTKKTNLVPIDLKVEQIAGAPAVTFDWKTGGHSFGSIAQYWKDVLGEAVLGTEGNYALAYGQLALVNTIVEAREIDKLKARVAELEAEVKRLTAN